MLLTGTHVISLYGLFIYDSETKSINIVKAI